MDSGILMIQDSILVCSPDPRIPHTAIECFASTAELLHPQKRGKGRRLFYNHNRLNQRQAPRSIGKIIQRFQVLFDSGCSAIMINKRFVKHLKKIPVKAIKWSAKAGPKEAVALN
jgi:hypothetical protein